MSRGAGETEPGAGEEAPPGHRGHRQRLREHFLGSEASALPDYELLEVLLFHAIDRIDVKPLAKALLREFGSLGGVLAAEPTRLAAHQRVNERTLALFKCVRETSRRILRERIADRPVLSSWSALVDYCRASLADEPVERFRILFLDKMSHRLRSEATVWTRGMTS